MGDEIQIRRLVGNTPGEKETIMIGDYLVVALVFGIAGAFVFIIHHFWLRDAFKEEAPASAPAEEEGECRVSTVKASPEQHLEEHYETL